jgi:hypothetical protein
MLYSSQRTYGAQPSGHAGRTLTSASELVSTDVVAFDDAATQRLKVTL